VSQETSNRRIKFAYYLDGWSYSNGNRNILRTNGVKIIPSEYIQSMDGSLFCPACYTNLNRIPKYKDRFSNNRDAYFAHIIKYKDIECNLRATKPEGRRYESYEEAYKAIDDENLVIVSEFIKEKPELANIQKNEYDETPVEDQNGPVSEVPIGRHNGETFKLPSKIKTVAGICRNFDDNLYKYYYFSGQRHAIQLLDLLKNVENIQAEDNLPRLYYGTIKKSFNAGIKPKPTNIRMTELRSSVY
jgi:hypothetical protein